MAQRKPKTQTKPTEEIEAPQVPETEPETEAPQEETVSEPKPYKVITVSDDPMISKIRIRKEPTTVGGEKNVDHVVPLGTIMTAIGTDGDFTALDNGLYVMSSFIKQLAEE